MITRTMALVATFVIGFLALLAGYFIGQGEGFVEGRYRACMDFAEGWAANGLAVPDGDDAADTYFDLKYECEQTYQRAKGDWK